MASLTAPGDVSVASRCGYVSASTIALPKAQTAMIRHTVIKFS
jgi:hypothetical protein